MFGLRKIPSAVIIVSLTLMAAVAPQTAAAQDDTVTVYLQPVVAETGDTLQNMCLKLGDASNTGCDENGDGSIAFEGMHPGTYPVMQETIIAGIVQLGDGVSITVTDSPSEQYFTVEFHELGAGDTTPVPTVTPTVVPPAAGSQDTGNGGANPVDTTGSSATALPNTGTGSGFAVSTSALSLTMLALLAVASIATLGGCLLRWRRSRA